MPNTKTKLIKSALEEFGKLIDNALFKAWQAGKRQKNTPYKYTLDADVLGRPLADAISKQITLAYEVGKRDGAKAEHMRKDGRLDIIHQLSKAKG